MKISDKEHQRVKMPETKTTDSTWKSLYIIGGVAALIAGVVFRRNIGPEISLFSMTTPPNTALDWFTLLQSDKFIGLAFLDVFDLVNYSLLGLMLLSLYIALRETNASHMLISTVLGFVGLVISFSSNTAFSMLALSDQYASATTDAQRSMFLAAGEAILAINEGAGAIMSFLFLAIAGLMISVVMLQSDIFSRRSAYVGILASICDLNYCITVTLAPAISVFFVSTAGLLLMIWHILIGRKLYLLGRALPISSAGI